MKSTYEATLPFFSGFYETYAASICDIDESELDYINEAMADGNQDERVDEKLYAEFSAVVKEDDKDEFILDLVREYSAEYDHHAAQAAYAGEYASAVCEMLKIPYIKHEMTSPKFYNFETDKIHLQIGYKTLCKWVKRLKSDEEVREHFERIIKDNCTSYDGFISFHSNKIEGYLGLRVAEWDSVKAGFLLYAIALTDCAYEMQENTCGGGFVFEEELNDSLRGNGFSERYEADLGAILAKQLSEYRDQNPDDDYIAPLPSQYLKGTVAIMPNHNT